MAICIKFGGFKSSFALKYFVWKYGVSIKKSTAEGNPLYVGYIDLNLI